MEEYCINDNNMDKIKWIDEVIERGREAAWLEGPDRALQWLQPLLFDEPGYGRLHLALAEIYHRYSEDLILAEIHYRQAILFDAELNTAYNGLTEILSEDERYNDVISVCEAGLRVSKVNKAQLLEAMGKSWELKQKYRRAIRHYRKALRYSAQLFDCKVLEESIRRCKRKQR